MKNSLPARKTLHYFFFVFALFILSSNIAHGQCEIKDDYICPDDITVCANEIADGKLGAYFEFLNPPAFGLTCDDGSEGYSFNMKFELPANTLSSQCWDFIHTSRVGGSGGHIKLFKVGSSGPSTIQTPKVRIEESTDIRIDIIHVDNDFTYTLYLVPEGGGTDILIDSKLIETTESVKFNTGSTPAGTYNVKFHFTYTGSEPGEGTKADNIGLDGVLDDLACGAGIDFVVTGPDDDFYLVGDTLLTYTATYTSSSGDDDDVAICSFNVRVDGITIEGTPILTDESCSGDNGTASFVIKSTTDIIPPDLYYSLDNWSNQTAFPPNFESGDVLLIEGLAADDYILKIRDYSFDNDCDMYPVYDFTIGGGKDNISPSAICQDVTVQLDANGNGSTTAQLVDNGSNDACGIASLALDNSTFTCADVATNPNQVTLTVTDNNGNQSTCTANVTVEDNIAPEANCQNITVQLNDSGSALITAAQINNGSGNACGIDTLFLDNYSFDCSNVGENTVTLTVKDVNGNSSTCNATVNVKDKIAPELTIPSNITIQCHESTTPESTGTATATDNCEIKNITFLDNEEAGSCPQEKIIYRTWKAVDINDNETTEIQTITVSDDINPTANNPESVNVQCINDVPAPDVTVVTNEADNCTTTPTVAFVSDVSNENTCPEVITRTYSVTDDCGNSINVVQTITVNDDTNPELTVPAEASVECSAIPEVGTATATDNCDADVTVVYDGETRTNGDCADTYTLTRSWTATDNCDNSTTKTQTINVSDNTAPELTVPAEASVECSAIPEVGTATATDNCDADVTVVYDGETRTDGDCADTYTLTRSWTATDNCDNSTTETQTINVSDNTAPELTVPAEENVECSAIPEVGTATATDNCDADVTVVYDGETRTDGTCADTYTLTRSWTATDNCDNSTTETQTINVSDNTAPELTVPAEVSVECSAIPELGTATATDNCDAEVTVAYDGETRTDGDCDDTYTLTRSWTATDNCGNSTTETQTINVSDNTAPELTVPAEASVECSAIPEVGTATATDNCDAEVTVAYDGETRTDGDCADTYTLTRSWTATDNCGNSTTETQTINVSDNTPPELTVPAEASVECSAIPELGIATASDNCDAEVTVEFNGETRTDGDCAGAYTLIRSWTATDNCGNSTTETQTINVSDNTAPTMACNDITIGLDANGTYTLTAADILLITKDITDNCASFDDLTFELSNSSFTCDDLEEAQSITVTATDNCGNSATCNISVSVEEGDADCDPLQINAVDDVVTLVICKEDGSVSSSLDFLSNDRGIEREQMIVTVTNVSTEGIEIDKENGMVTYNNVDGYLGEIVLEYTICDFDHPENCDDATITFILLVDTDCDEIPDVIDIDDDNDGIPDDDENAEPNVDGDSIPNSLDIDSDDDGIVDLIEWQSTSTEGNYDQVGGNEPFRLPSGIDENKNGWDDIYEYNYYPAIHSDNDDELPDYLDTDSDGDSIPDIEEAWPPFTELKQLAGIDKDGDGLDDTFDTIYSWISEIINQTASDTPLPNTIEQVWKVNEFTGEYFLVDTLPDGQRDWRDNYTLGKEPKQSGEFFIPNGFSPNDDGVHDYFWINFAGLDDDDEYIGSKIEIFNRWGIKVYELDKYGDESIHGSDAWWDGRANIGNTVGNDRLPPATYFYILQYKNGREADTGFIFLNK